MMHRIVIYFDLYNCILPLTWVCCRELAIQIAEQFQALGSEIGVKCAVVSI